MPEFPNIQYSTFWSVGLVAIGIAALLKVIFFFKFLFEDDHYSSSLILLSLLLSISGVMLVQKIACPNAQNELASYTRQVECYKERFCRQYAAAESPQAQEVLAGKITVFNEELEEMQAEAKNKFILKLYDLNGFYNIESIPENDSNPLVSEIIPGHVSDSVTKIAAK